MSGNENDSQKIKEALDYVEDPDDKGILCLQGLTLDSLNALDEFESELINCYRSSTGKIIDQNYLDDVREALNNSKNSIRHIVSSIKRGS